MKLGTLAFFGLAGILSVGAVLYSQGGFELTPAPSQAEPVAAIPPKLLAQKVLAAKNEEAARERRERDDQEQRRQSAYQQSEQQIQMQSQQALQAQTPVQMPVQYAPQAAQPSQYSTTSVAPNSVVSPAPSGDFGGGVVRYRGGVREGQVRTSKY